MNVFKASRAGLNWHTQSTHSKPCKWSERRMEVSVAVEFFTVGPTSTLQATHISYPLVASYMQQSSKLAGIQQQLRWTESSLCPYSLRESTSPDEICVFVSPICKRMSVGLALIVAAPCESLDSLCVVASQHTKPRIEWLRFWF